MDPRWGCLSLDRPTRFVVAFAASEDEAAPQVVAQTRWRTWGQRGVPWVGNGRAVYRQELRRIYRDLQRTGKRGRPRLVLTPGVGLSRVVKRRRHGRVVGIGVCQVMGASVECPYAVHEKRLNGVLRDRLNCLTRKTHAFAKEERTWDAAVTLFLWGREILCPYWLRPHPALREPMVGLLNGRRYLGRTPAMGLTDHIGVGRNS